MIQTSKTFGKQFHVNTCRHRFPANDTREPPKKTLKVTQDILKCWTSDKDRFSLYIYFACFVLWSRKSFVITSLVTTTFTAGGEQMVPVVATW
jgi:hypothetical protein